MIFAPRSPAPPQRALGKRLILKGKFIVTTEEPHRQLVEAEKNTKQKKAKKQPKTRSSRADIEDMEDGDIDEDMDEVPWELQDCIEVSRG